MEFFKFFRCHSRQGQVATDAELQCLKVARLRRDVCGSRRPEPAHRHSPLASGILSRPNPQCILSQTCPCRSMTFICEGIFAFSGDNVLIRVQMTVSGTYNSSVLSLMLRGGGYKCQSINNIQNLRGGFGFRNSGIFSKLIFINFYKPIIFQERERNQNK